MRITVAIQPAQFSTLVALAKADLRQPRDQASFLLAGALNEAAIDAAFGTAPARVEAGTQ